MALLRAIDRESTSWSSISTPSVGQAIASESGLGHVAGLFRVPWPIIGGVARGGVGATVSSGRSSARRASHAAGPPFLDREPPASSADLRIG